MFPAVGCKCTLSRFVYFSFLICSRLFYFSLKCSPPLVVNVHSHDYREPLSSSPWIKTNAAPAFQTHILFRRKWGQPQKVHNLDLDGMKICIWCPQIANRRKEMPNFLGLVEPMQIHPQFYFQKSLHHLFLQDCKKVFPTKSEAQLIGGPNKLSFEDVITQSLSLIYLHCSLLPLESFDNIMNYVVVC